ncbi:MAG: protease pro-enzyme activation domain-containing protein [Acidobacteriota bacterium]|nr:protease pro-enzyme activation domain-containing protein [Acidobacteriota bacterium]
MNGERAEIPGSAPQHSESASRSTPLAAGEQLTATIVLRRRPGSPHVAEQLLSGQYQPVSREQAEELTGASGQDVAAVESFAKQYGLEVVEADAAKRVVKVRGSAEALNGAFGVELGLFGNYTSYSGPITIPASLDGIVIAVLGLDNRPIARPRTTEASA